MFKRIGYVFLVFMLIVIPVALVGCGNGDENSSDGNNTEIDSPIEKPSKPDEKPDQPDNPEESVDPITKIAQEVVKFLEDEGIIVETYNFEPIYKDESVTLQIPQEVITLTGEEIEDAALLDAVPMEGYSWSASSQIDFVIIMISPIE